jgi:hypothetical protein
MRRGLPNENGSMPCSAANTAIQLVATDRGLLREAFGISTDTHSPITVSCADSEAADESDAERGWRYSASCWSQFVSTTSGAAAQLASFAASRFASRGFIVWAMCTTPASSAARSTATMAIAAFTVIMAPETPLGHARAATPMQRATKRSRSGASLPAEDPAARNVVAGGGHANDPQPDASAARGNHRHRVAALDPVAVPPLPAGESPFENAGSTRATWGTSATNERDLSPATPAALDTTPFDE